MNPRADVCMKTIKPRISTIGASGCGWKPDAKRGNRHERGYGYEWEKTRKRVLERDCGICQPGLKLGELHHARQVDHVVSKAEGRAHGWSKAQIEADANLQSICDACHKAKTARESQGGGV